MRVSRIAMILGLALLALTACYGVPASDILNEASVSPDRENLPAYCTNGEVNPIGQRVADSLEVPYEQVLEAACERGYSFEDVFVVYRVAAIRADGTTTEEIFRGLNQGEFTLADLVEAAELEDEVDNILEN